MYVLTDVPKDILSKLDECIDEKGLNPVKAVGYGGLANVGAELATGKPIVSPKDIGLGDKPGPSSKQKGIKKFTQTGGSGSDIPDYVKQGRFIQGK